MGPSKVDCHNNFIRGDYQMDWQTALISMYLTIVDIWNKELFLLIEKNSNYKSKLTDEEVIVIFLNGIIRGRRNLKEIFNYTKSHMQDWFPHLKEYEDFVYRINALAEIFPPLIACLQKLQVNVSLDTARIVDSFPIILAKSKRSNGAKVASDVADKGYCASRDEYYYGVKVHLVGPKRETSLPLIETAYMSSASTHDLVFFRENIAHLYCNVPFYADKAYIDSDTTGVIKERGLTMIIPNKKERGIELNMFEKMDSADISKRRQPIESLISWISEKTGIQKASKVRSTKGLHIHVFGRLAAAVMIMIFNF